MTSPSGEFLQSRIAALEKMVHEKNEVLASMKRLQDLEAGRVIPNLITKAFYAVTEKKKESDDNYQTIVTISTKKLSDKDSIYVKDNGNGIPQRVLDKIFQPFFTTNPLVREQVWVCR